ncbi:Uncharacterised protein [Mycobacterium tuberculosis]|nr:Uncharacterised protein [Mycobacterium tuberculosis]
MMDARNRAKVAWESTACERVLPLGQLLIRIGNRAPFWGARRRPAPGQPGHQLVDSGIPSAYPDGFWIPTVARSWNSSSVRAPA